MAEVGRVGAAVAGEAAVAVLAVDLEEQPAFCLH